MSVMWRFCPLFRCEQPLLWCVVSTCAPRMWWSCPSTGPSVPRSRDSCYRGGRMTYLSTLWLPARVRYSRRLKHVCHVLVSISRIQYKGTISIPKLCDFLILFLLASLRDFIVCSILWSCLSLLDFSNIFQYTWLLSVYFRKWVGLCGVVDGKVSTQAGNWEEPDQWLETPPPWVYHGRTPDQRGHNEGQERPHHPR